MTYIVICCMLLLSFVLLNRIYFKPVSYIQVNSDHRFVAASCKPSSSWFRSVASSRSYSFVSLGSGYFALFFNSDLTDQIVNFKQISFSSDFYIFKRSRFGRFKSIDCSDRCLIDILNKIS